MRTISSVFFATLWVLLAPAPAWTLVSSREISVSDGVRQVEKIVREGDRSVELQCVFFQTPRHNLQVVDRPEGTRVRAAVEAVGGVAGINGGYFHPNYGALGLIVTGGRKVHDLEKASLLSGVIAATADRLLVLRYAQYKLGPKTRDALQAGPFLIDGVVAVKGLNDDREARRSVVLTDGKRDHAILTTGRLTLAEAAEVLATPGVISEWKLTRALNLDGGSSTGLFVAAERLFDQPNLKRVRTVLAIVPRS